MRPRNDREREVERLAKGLPWLTDAQAAWVRDKVAVWHINSSGRRCWCERCGHVFRADHPRGNAVCPDCGAELPVEGSRRRVRKDYEYVQIVTTHAGWQVIRYFIVRWRSEIGREPWIRIWEIMQKWCQPGRPTVTRGVPLVFMPYYVEVPYSDFGPMSIKHPSYFYTEWMRLRLYPRVGLLKPYRSTSRFWRHKGVMTAGNVLGVIYSIPYFETLLKGGEYAELKTVSDYAEEVRKYWPSVRVALRHGFKPREWRDYFDYLGMLSYLRRDMRSPRYVAPPDYDDIHYLILRQYQNKRAEEERRRREREALLRAEAEERRLRQEADQIKSFEERIEHFRKLLIAAGGIEIRPLMTIQEFAEEGKAMRHCVFALGYYKKPDSLILSARDRDGNRIETVEVDVRRGVVLQSRGFANSLTESHEKILAMVESGMGEIQRMAAS